MGKVWQEKQGGRWRSVTACNRCGKTVRVTQLGSHPFVDCGDRVLDLGELRPARIVQANPFAAGPEPEFTARHFALIVGACALIAAAATAWAFHCGWRPI